MKTTSCRWLNCNHPPFETELDCYNHIKLQHTKSGPQSCRWIIEKNSNINPQSSIHNPQDALSLCDIDSKHRGHFVEHIVSHFSFNLRPLNCSHCGETFRNRQDFKRHEKLNHPNETVRPSFESYESEKSEQNNTQKFDTQKKLNSFPISNYLEVSSHHKIRRNSMIDFNTNQQNYVLKSQTVDFQPLPYSAVGLTPSFFKRYCTVLMDHQLVLPANMLSIIENVNKQGGRIPPFIETELIVELINSHQISLSGLTFVYSEAGKFLLADTLIKKFNEKSQKIWEDFKLIEKSQTSKLFSQKKKSARHYLKSTLVSLLQLFWKTWKLEVTNEDDGQLVERTASVFSKSSNESYSVGLQVTINHQVDFISLSNRKSMFYNSLNYFKEEVESKLEIKSSDGVEKIIISTRIVDFPGPKFIIWFKFGTISNETSQDNGSRNGPLTLLGFLL
ncbi:hypothetical protein HK099_008053 [Clydaea vesicula]|uniref:C2H2-type domain-containing protein n=1 Tax=Clydaea vesicula TaxID=447962 RepID=A0AAD5XTA3_9FUNG|nr:hypothetical protein HK099_008053 [Clydaea vesicula]KAJ3378632.1 hypothetical protein HDU92_007260 [Lobulomyces angularis]